MRQSPRLLSKRLLLSRLLLFRPPAPHGLGDAPAPLGGQISFLLDGFLRRPSRASFRFYCGTAAKQSARVLQLGNLAINLSNNL